MASPIDHLRIAEREARKSLFEASPNPAVLARTWPLITSTALAASRRIEIPDPSRVAERVALIGDGLHEANARKQWPGDGHPDPHLRLVVAALAATANNERPITDIEAQHAHRLIASTLWTTSHLLARDTRDHLVDLDATNRVTTSTFLLRERDLVRDVLERATAAEAVCSPVRISRDSEADGPGAQLAYAVADWDVQAHRALLTRRSTSTLALIAANEASVQRSFAQAVRTAGDFGVIDRATTERLTPVLASLENAWSSLAKRVIDLSWGSEMVPRETLIAADRLRGSFEATDSADLGKEDHARVVDALADQLASSLSLSTSTRALIDEGDLRAPARAINRVLRSLPGFTDNVEAVVSPEDLLQATSIPLPPAARSLLREGVDRVSLESGEAARRGAGLDQGPRIAAQLEAPPSRQRGSWSSTPASVMRQVDPRHHARP